MLFMYWLVSPLISFQRNLVSNGGLLDGVIWLQRTNNTADLALLDKLIASEPLYERWIVDSIDTTPNDLRDYATSYDRIQDDVLYIKIDDDIVRFCLHFMSIWSYHGRSIYRNRLALFHVLTPVRFSSKMQPYRLLSIENFGSPSYTLFQPMW